MQGHYTELNVESTLLLVGADYACDTLIPSTQSHLSPPMAMPSYTPLVVLEMMLFSSFDIPPDRDTYATLVESTEDQTGTCTHTYL